MRKKLKPDLNLEEIQQSLINETVELYNSGLSLRKTAQKLSMSPMKVRKTLLTACVYSSAMQKDRPLGPVKNRLLCFFHLSWTFCCIC